MQGCRGKEPGAAPYPAQRQTDRQTGEQDLLVNDGDDEGSSDDHKQDGEHVHVDCKASGGQRLPGAPQEGAQGWVGLLTALPSLPSPSSHPQLGFLRRAQGGSLGRHSQCTAHSCPRCGLSTLLLSPEIQPGLVQGLGLTPHPVSSKLSGCLNGVPKQYFTARWVWGPDG